MAGIEVTPIGAGEFTVEVHEEGEVTSHRVTVPDGYPGELGVEEVALHRLVQESFHFLLQREPKEQILRSFDLPTIARYFPEYPEEISRRLR
jgi:hypothetical protein